MTYLLDANVVSEPTKPAPDAKVVAWLSAHEGDVAVDSVVLGEVCLGILLLPKGRKRARLEAWFEAVVQTIDCLPWDAAVSRRWARLVSELRRKGEAMPVFDAMIAATALEHDLTVATRNVADFQHAGLRVVNPFV
jgi:predicted nucleic acid-binding protein